MTYKKIINFLIFSISLITFGLFFGYVFGYPTTLVFNDCDKLNSSISQIQCNAIKEPLSQDGISYFSVCVLFSPLLLIIFAQIKLISDTFYIIL